MINLLEETLEKLKDNDKSPEDVKWVGTYQQYFSWEEFEDIARHEIYNDGYGAQEVAYDLMIVGEGFWLERCEYDGSEWWEFKSSIKKPSVHKVPNRLTGGMWSSLDAINNSYNDSF